MRKIPARLLLLSLLILFSGMAGLIYEVVWMRMLIRVFGITLYAVSTIISVYMGGLALGSLFFGRMAARRKFTLKNYGWIELGIGVSALLATMLVGKLPELYAGIVTVDSAAPASLFVVTLIRIGFSAVAMLIPTMLMGSTLPLITQVWAGEKVGSRLAALYGFNTVGAVIGILYSGFVSIGIWGETATVLTAVGLNFAVGLVFIKINWSGLSESTDEEAGLAERFIPESIGVARFVLYAAAVSGFCALSLEVLWTRILILVLGTSVYAFSMMLALYLAGIGIGSLLAARWLDRVSSPLSLFAILQAGVAIMGLLSLNLFRMIGLRTADVNFLYSPLNKASDFYSLIWMGAVVIVPITLLLGAIFPLMGRLITRDTSRSGSSVGSLYAWNTIGGIAGSIATAYFLIPHVGTQLSFTLVCITSLVIAGASLVLFKRKSRLMMVLAAVSVLLLFLIPRSANIYLEVLANRLFGLGGGKIFFHQEEASATLTGYENSEGNKSLLINGIITSDKGLPGKLMAHLPLLLHPDPQKALVICFGVGNTFKSAVDHIGRVDAVELVKGVVDNFHNFYDDAAAYLDNPQVRIFINDGRNYILTSKENYDVIIIDASPPIFSEGTVNLYSLEFIKLCRQRLTSNGIMFLWVPIPCFEDDFWMIARNFDQTFAHTFVWTHPRFAGIMLMGSDEPFNTSVSILTRRIKERHLDQTAPWLTLDILRQGWSLSEDEINKFARNFPPVTDDMPYTEFPLKKFLREDTFWTDTSFILNARQVNPKQ